MDVPSDILSGISNTIDGNTIIPENQQNLNKYLTKKTKIYNDGVKDDNTSTKINLKKPAAQQK